MIQYFHFSTNPNVACLDSVDNEDPSRFTPPYPPPPPGSQTPGKDKRIIGSFFLSLADLKTYRIGSKVSDARRSPGGPL